MTTLHPQGTRVTLDGTRKAGTVTGYGWINRDEGAQPVYLIDLAGHAFWSNGEDTSTPGALFVRVLAVATDGVTAECVRCGRAIEREAEAESPDRWWHDAGPITGRHRLVYCAGYEDDAPDSWAGARHTADVHDLDADDLAEFAARVDNAARGITRA